MIEFEEKNELWLLNFLRLKAYYTYCRPGLKVVSVSLLGINQWYECYGKWRNKL